MHNDRATHKTTDGNYQRATQVETSENLGTATTTESGRVVSSTREKEKIVVRITTRQAFVSRSTE